MEPVPVDEPCCEPQHTINNQNTPDAVNNNNGSSITTNLTTYKLFDDSIRQVETVFARFIEPLLHQEYELMNLQERLEKLHNERIEYNLMLRTKHAKIVENIEAYLVSLTKPNTKPSFNQNS